jgi:hypothetical protein
MSAAARRVLVVDVPVLAAIFSRRLGTTGLTVLTDPAAIGGDERLACALLDLATGVWASQQHCWYVNLSCA